MYLVVFSSASITKEFFGRYLRTNDQRSKKPLKQKLDRGAVFQTRIENEGISWKFPPPRTPHFGEARESLVRQAKLTLYRALDKEKK